MFGYEIVFIKNKENLFQYFYRIYLISKFNWTNDKRKLMWCRWVTASESYIV